MSLPKILCIGAQKAGTSWLHENLAKNSAVWVPPFKELHFFDHKFVPANRKWTPWHVQKSVRQTRERWEKQGRATPAKLAYLQSILERPILNGTWYKRIFAACPDDRVGLDVTPEYASIPEEGIVFLLKFLGRDTRIIYIVRDPVDRAVSQLSMNLARHKKDMPKTDSAWLDAANHEAIVDRGNYKSHIPRWDAHFEDGQILYVPFGTIAADPLGLLREIEDFARLPSGTYAGAERVVFAGGATTVPEFVRTYYRKSLAEQSIYLTQRFGHAFVKHIK